MADTPNQLWHHYFDPYLAKSKKLGTPVLDMLDQEWADGKATVEQCLLPYMPQAPVALEIASGLGRVTRHLAPLCSHLTCCDISERSLSQLQQIMGEQPDLSYQLIDGYSLQPLPDQSFDLVCSFTTFFHLDFDVVLGYFREIRRVLKAGGIGVLEFKRWVDQRDVEQLVRKIESSGGPAGYARQLDKWRYVTSDMLNLLSRSFDLEVLREDVTSYTFRRRP